MTHSQVHEQMHELISRRLDADLSVIESQKLDDHLRLCSPCRQFSDEMNIAITQLRGYSQKSLSPERRLRIEKDLEQDGYMSSRLPLGQRISRFLVSLTRTPPRLAWSISALVLIIGVGLALHSGQAPQGPSRSSSQPHRVSMSNTDFVGQPKWAYGDPTSFQQWDGPNWLELPRDASTQFKSYSASKWPIEVRRQSHASKKQSIVNEDELIQIGDYIYIKLLKTDLAEAYVSAFLVAIDGSSHVLIRQQEVLAGHELGPIEIPSTSGMQKLVFVVAKLPVEIRSLAGECRINTSTLWCFSIGLKDETQNSQLTP